MCVCPRSLRKLLSDGIADSDVVLVLGTRSVFTRPWCLLECEYAARLGTPVLVVEVKKSGFSIDESREYIDNLETSMDAQGVALLREHLGNDLTNLKKAVHSILSSHETAKAQSRELTWEPSAGDVELVAEIKDISEAMARTCGKELKWKTKESPNERRMSRRGSRVKALMTVRPVQKAAQLHIMCSKSEVLKDARVLQTEMAMKMGCLVSVTQGSDISSTTDTQGSEDASARVLAIDESQGSEALVLLLTSTVLHEASFLLSVYRAIVHGKVIIPICIFGRGYEFAVAATHLSNLAESLDARARSALETALDGELDAEGNPITVSSLGSKLHAVLSRIIAVHWDTVGTKNHLDAVVTSVASRIKNQEKPVDVPIKIEPQNFRKRRKSELIQSNTSGKDSAGGREVTASRVSRARSRSEDFSSTGGGALAKVNDWVLGTDRSGSPDKSCRTASGQTASGNASASTSVVQPKQEPMHAGAGIPTYRENVSTGSPSSADASSFQTSSFVSDTSSQPSAAPNGKSVLPPLPVASAGESPGGSRLARASDRNLTERIQDLFHKPDASSQPSAAPNGKPVLPPLPVASAGESPSGSRPARMSERNLTERIQGLFYKTPDRVDALHADDLHA